MKVRILIEAEVADIKAVVGTINAELKGDITRLSVEEVVPAKVHSKEPNLTVNYGDKHKDNVWRAQ